MSNNYCFKPANKDTWNDVEKLFGERGACGGCWCMAFRLKRKEFDASKGLKNKELFQKIINSNIPCGIIGFIDETPIGWCSISPRENFIILENSRTLKRIDDASVWSITCLFVDKNYRKTGISVKLIQSAVEYAKSEGAKIVEAYPFDYQGKEMPPPFVHTGIFSGFIKAGFVEVERRSKSRPIMRCNIIEL